MASLLNVQTKFQNIKIDPSLRSPGEIVLYCDDAWQLDSAVEWKYHESLVTIPLACAPGAARVLICGGGDGMALRESLKFPEIVQSTLVEIDEEMIRLFRDDDRWAKFNSRSMRHSRARVVAADALAFAREDKDLYDLIVLDFPSPGGRNKDKNYPNLYSPESLAVFAARLKPHGVLSMQVSMPYIYLAAAANFLLGQGFNVWNYDTYYNPRNADSFMVASRHQLTPQRNLPLTRWADLPRCRAAFSQVTEINRSTLDYYRLFCHGEDVEFENV